MRLSPRELDGLLLSQAGHTAQRRLARGLRLNQPETIALIASQVWYTLSDSNTLMAHELSRFCYINDS